MNYNSYLGKINKVDAGQFTTEVDVGEIVQDLYDSGCSFISVTISPLNPQLEVSTLLTHITFLSPENHIQTLFLNDYLVFFSDGNVVAYPQVIFEEEFMIEEVV